MNLAEIDAYYDGIREGLYRYAHWKDGEQYVGTCGTTLKDALAAIEIERMDAHKMYSMEEANAS